MFVESLFFMFLCVVFLQKFSGFFYKYMFLVSYVQKKNLVMS